MSPKVSAKASFCNFRRFNPLIFSGVNPSFAINSCIFIFKILENVPASPVFTYEAVSKASLGEFRSPADKAPKMNDFLTASSSMEFHTSSNVIAEPSSFFHP